MNSNWSYTPETLNSGRNRRFVLSPVNLKFDGWPWKTIGHLFYATPSLVHHFKSIVGSKSAIFVSRVTLKFDGWPWKTIGHLFYVASSFVHHFTAINYFKLELQSRNAQFWSKSTIFSSRVTLKFNGWPWITIGHLFYGTSSFVQHFVPIGEFKLELQSRNAQSRSNSTICSDVWPWSLTDDLEKQ